MPMSSVETNSETNSETSSKTNTEARLTPVPFDGVCPILRVRDVSASIDYYARMLGFVLDWQASYFASVSRGKCHIFLPRDQGQPGGWVWIGIEDADALFEEYRRSGAK